MSDEDVEKLRAAFVGAPAGVVVLDEAFWSTAGVAPPAGFAAALEAGFKTSSLSLTYNRAAVGRIVDNAFMIPDVGLTFLNADAASTVGAVRVEAAATVPTLMITVEPGQWQLEDYCPAMNGMPFTLLQFDRPRFVFSSGAASFEWVEAAATFPIAAGMTLYGHLAVPLDALPVASVIQGLGPIATTLVASGSIDFAKVDNETVLYPDMRLEAPLASGGGLAIFFLEIARPRLTFVIASRAGTASELLEDEGTDDNLSELAELGFAADDPVVFQTPTFGVAADLAIQGGGTRLGYVVEAMLDASAAGYEADFSLTAVVGEERLTPAAAIQLLGGTSFFADVPAPLQQALSTVALQGLVAEVELKPMTALSAVTLALGSSGPSLTFFDDPTTGQAFELVSFAMTFTVSDPLSAERETDATFQAAFTLFPAVFRTKTGEPGGLFEIEIDSTLDFEGGFSGKASFDDVLRKITGGAIGLPDGVAVAFSDIYLMVQPSVRSYALQFEVDASLEVPFFADGDKPLIQVVGMQFALGASTPKAEAGTKARTVYTGSIAGQILIGELAANVAVAYDGAAVAPVWRLEASLAQPLSLSELVNQFFRAYDLPDIVPGDLQVTALDIKATIPGKTAAPTSERLRSTRPARHVAHAGHAAGWRSPARAAGLLRAEDAAPAKSYELAATLAWSVTIGSIAIDTEARIGLAYDAGKPDGQRYSGSVIGMIELDAIGEIEVGYRFGTTGQDLAAGAPASAIHPMRLAATADSTTLWLAWKGFRAAYDRSADTVTFTLTGWSVGSLLTALVEMLGDPYFTLPSPWDLLNRISLDGLSIVFHMKKEAGKPRVSATYTLGSSIDLGIVRIEGLSFGQVDGKVRLGIVGSTSIPGLEKSPLFTPAGQPVDDMPKVPGRGNAFFDLRLLALGQRVKIYEPGAFGSTKEVIAALERIPASGDKALPFDPAQARKGQPYYDPGSDWLAAMDFGLLQIAGTKQYAFELMIVFNDPDLYGLRLALSGDKVKVLAGLVIDVLYKKITDDVGCYQIEFTLPSVLRNLDFGAFAVTLPVIGLQVYTNGDFLVDFGFPYNLDFARSFTAQAIILGVPVLGSAGFYFGKLSNATAPGLPATTKGTFHPVVVFGFGAQLGLGRTIDKGVLKAGFSITVFGIIEGTIAAWHPYANGNSGSAGEVQGDYYFKLAGSFGLIGKLYGTVDFAVVKADVSLTVQLVASIAYESFRAIPLSLSASVSVKVTISIDCGFFSIDLSFSFETRLQVELTIGHDSLAPWDAEGTAFLPRHLHVLGLTGKVASFDADRARAARALVLGEPVPKAVLTLTAVPQFTVLGPDGGTTEGAFVLLFAMDAPKPGGGDGAATSFGRLCAALLPWVIAGAHTHAATTDWLADGTISRVQLQAILVALGDPAMSPFDAAAITAFLADHFTVEIVAGDATLGDTRRATLDAGTTIFPAIPALSLTIPDPAAATGTVTIELSRYATATPAYEIAIRERFAEIAAAVAKEGGGPATAAAPRTVEPQPLAACVLVDYALLLARQLVQGAIDAFDDYAYPLEATTTLDAVVAWADAAQPGQVGVAAIAQANLLYPLAAGKTLIVGDAVAPIVYTVQTGDTLATIAARYTGGTSGTNAQKLVVGNGARTTLVVPGVTVVLGSASTVTVPGDSFASIAARLGATLDVLAQDVALQGQAGLLAPSAAITVPDVTVVTRAGDTLQGLMDRYSMPLAALLGAANRAVAGLFAPDATLRFAVPMLAVLPEAAIWPAILRNGTLGHLAGMAARYMMHGMRLPRLDGLQLPSNFLYGTPHWPVQEYYGLYQLTGQQFPLAERNPGTALTLSRPATGCDWLQLGGGASLQVALASNDPTETLGPKELLGKVLGVVRGNGFAPLVTGLAVEPQVDLVPKRYATGTFARWSSADIAGLVVSASPTGGRTVAAAAPQPQPILWSLSSALMRAAETRQAALAAFIPSTADARRYMPLLAAEAGTRDPATGATSFSPLADYALATRVDFKVKHLAQDADLAPQTPLANDIVPPGGGNAGSPARALAPCAYEIVGPSAAEAVLLERLLTAMADAGEGIVSGLFLAWADGAGGGVLVSRAPSEFLSFIVQSNLSTETNPPNALLRAAALAAPAPRGIANSPAEFIKLLWELSTVNSGGTYLYFQLIADGSGLPPTLFDASGLATLTLVVTHARQADGARLSNAVNALLTTSAVDPHHAIVDLVGVPAPVASLALDAGLTPRGIASGYGLDLGSLARANFAAPLRAGSLMPVAGLYRQLTVADMGSGDPLAVLAAYFSVGAATPVTRADLVAFNPGVTVKALALIRIPPLVYRVGGSGPGATLASISAYYAADATALLVAAADVGGLFIGPTLTIEPQAFDAQNRLGLGNAGLTLQRERGDKPAKLAPNAPQTDVEAYARATMLQLYGLAAARLRANAFFEASVEGAPFGPLERDDGGAAPPQARRLAAAMTPAANTPYRYGQALGYRRFAKIEAAPSGSPSPDPYRGVGTILQAELEWQDLFGNRLPQPFSSNGPGVLPAPLFYADRLVPLDQWPSTTRSHRYDGVAGAPVLHIDLAFDTTPYNPATQARHAHLDVIRPMDELPLWQRTAIDDLARFTLVHSQLVQDYTGLGVPGLNGPAVSMALRNSLLAAPLRPLSTGERAALLGFVEAVMVYLAARAAAKPATAPAPLDLAVAIDVGALVTTTDIVEIVVTLEFERVAALVAPALRGVDGGTRAVSTVPAHGGAAADAAASGDPVPVDFSGYAKAFERLFATADWAMRVGAGAADPAAPADARASTLWAVRMAVAAGVKPAGIGFAIGGNAVYYAPLPVASALQALTVDIRPYVSGSPYDPKSAGVPTTFASADPNVWLTECLTALDDVLAAQYATPCFVLDRLLGLTDAAISGADPATRGYLARLLAHKATLAAAIASTVRPVLAQPDTQRPAAREKFEQALLRRLDAMNTLACVAVLPVTKAHAAVPAGRTPPRLFGQPSGRPAGGSTDGNDNFAFSTAKIGLPATGDTSALAFLVTSRAAEQRAYLELDLAWAPTHVEHDIHGVRGIERYEQTRWISFLTKSAQAAIVPSGAAHFAIPVALRALPTPATVEAQTGTAAGDGTGSATDLKSWAYGFSYLLNQAAQDSVVATVEFNLPPENSSFGSVALDKVLYEALAQFAAIHAAVSRDIESFLRPIDGRSRAGTPEVETAKDAIAAFESVVGAVASAYDAWARGQDARALIAAAPPPAIVYVFEIVLEADSDGSALVRVRPQSFKRDGRDAANDLPLARIEIDEAGYAPELVSSDPATGEAAWRYLRRPGADRALPERLPYDTARLDSRRRVVFAPLDLFELQSAWSAVQVVRNRHLGPPGIVTNPAFEFKTAPSRFADPIVPFLRYPAVALDAAGAPPQSVQAWLSGFFGPLLGTGAEPRPVKLGIESGYRYALVPSPAVPATRLPVGLLPPADTGGGATPIVDAVAASAQDFFDVRAPRTDARAGFDFAVTVFAAAGHSDMPLLQIGALTLSAASIARA